MPRTREQIIAQAEELAKRFESYEPKPDDRRDASHIHALREAAQALGDAEQRISSAVADAREGGYSWALIGAQLGTSGEAARQKYGRAVRKA